MFRRREGPAWLPFSRGSPSSCSSSLSSVRGFLSFRGLPPADPGGIRPPFVLKYVFIVELSYTRGERQPGRPDVFPGRGCVRPQVRFPVAQMFKADVLRVSRVLGAVGRVSRSRSSTSSSPLLHSTILLFATKSRCASMAWGSTVFGVAGLVIHFEARKVVQWMLAHWLVLSCIHSRELAKTSLATPGVSVVR